MRLRASRISAIYASVVPWRRPSPTSAILSQVARQDPLIPKSAAICLRCYPGSRLRATRTTSSRNSFGWGFGTADTFPAAPLGTTDQMSPTRAADPISLWRTVSARSSLAGNPRRARAAWRVGVNSPRDMSRLRSSPDSSVAYSRLSPTLGVDQSSPGARRAGSAVLRGRRRPWGSGVWWRPCAVRRVRRGGRLSGRTCPGLGRRAFWGAKPRLRLRRRCLAAVRRLVRGHDPGHGLCVVPHIAAAPRKLPAGGAHVIPRPVLTEFPPPPSPGRARPREPLKERCSTTASPLVCPRGRHGRRAARHVVASFNWRTCRDNDAPART